MWILCWHNYEYLQYLDHLQKALKYQVAVYFLSYAKQHLELKKLSTKLRRKTFFCCCRSNIVLSLNLTQKQNVVPKINTLGQIR